MTGSRVALLWNLSDDWSLLGSYIFQDTDLSGSWETDPSLGRDHTIIRFIDEYRTDGVSDEDIAAARTALQTDLDAAVQYARDDGRRLNAEFDRALLTGDWQRLSTSVGCN